MLYPSDTVVLFGNAAYLYNSERDVNEDIGSVHIGKVDPGDSISAGFGFGFSLNPRFSYSLGYSHAYVMETETQITCAQEGWPVADAHDPGHHQCDHTRDAVAVLKGVVE